MCIRDSDGPGMRVNGVVEGSAADRAGLIKGEVLLAIDDELINDMLRLRQVLNRFEAGQEISVSVKRAVAKPEDEKEDEKDDGIETEVKQIKMVLGAVLDTTPKEPGEQQVEKPKVR